MSRWGGSPNPRPARTTSSLFTSSSPWWVFAGSWCGPKLKLCHESSQSSCVWKRLGGGTHVDGHARSIAARVGPHTALSRLRPMPHLVTLVHGERGALGDGRSDPRRTRSRAGGRDPRHARGRGHADELAHPRRHRRARRAGRRSPQPSALHRRPDRRRCGARDGRGARRVRPTPPSRSGGAHRHAEASRPRPARRRRARSRERVAALDLAEVVLEPWEDVDDPAGGDAEVFHAARPRSTTLLAHASRRSSSGTSSDAPLGGGSGGAGRRRRRSRRSLRRRSNGDRCRRRPQSPTRAVDRATGDPWRHRHRIKVGGLGQLVLYGAADVGAPGTVRAGERPGGVNGRTFEYLGVRDDGGVRRRHRRIATTLVEQDEVFAVVPAVTPDLGGGAVPRGAEGAVLRLGAVVDFCGNAWGFGFSGCTFPTGVTTSNAWGVLVQTAFGPPSSGRTAAIVTENIADGAVLLAHGHRRRAERRNPRRVGSRAPCRYPPPATSPRWRNRSSRRAWAPRPTPSS